MKEIIISLVFIFGMSCVCNAEDYHVKTQSNNARSATIVFHIPIPIENNVANIPLRTALSQYIQPRNEDGTFGTFQSQLQGIDGIELTQLRNGESYEHVEAVSFLAADTNTQKLTKIDEKYKKLEIGGLNKIRKILKFWGLNRNVP